MTMIYIYVLLGFVALCNIIVLFLGHKPSDLYQALWEEQSWIGRILANLFYAPAWIISIGMYFITKTTVKWVLMACHCFGMFALGFLATALIVYGIHWITIIGMVLALLLAICTKLKTLQN